MCADSTISRTINVQAVSIIPLEFENLLKIYPNPSSGLVTVEIDNADNSKMTMDIIDASGRIIYSNIFHSENVLEELDLTSFSSGIYYVRIISKEYFGIKKLILSTHK